MFVQFNRTTITPVWVIAFGLLALLWSPMSVAMGVLLLTVGVAGPVVTLYLWREPSPRVARAVPRVEES
jgi:hypothetical protein